MSSDENEGAAADPTGQFDAFRARQAEERAQQEETQAAYAFPPEYAAPPEPVFYPTQPVAAAPGNRTRSVLIFVGAVLVAGVLGLGAWLAFGSSSSPSTTAASSGSSVSATPSPTSSGKHALTFRVTIVSLGTDSFTGTVLSNGQSVTVTLTDKTRFGTKAQAFSRADLHVGELVAVRGKRTGTATVTATEVTQAVRSSA